jgi:hypothetical protein
MIRFARGIVNHLVARAIRAGNKRPPRPASARQAQGPPGPLEKQKASSKRRKANRCQAGVAQSCNAGKALDYCPIPPDRQGRAERPHTAHYGGFVATMLHRGVFKRHGHRPSRCRRYFSNLGWSGESAARHCIRQTRHACATGVHGGWQRSGAADQAASGPGCAGYPGTG